MKSGWMFSGTIAGFLICASLVCAQTSKNLKGQDPPPITASGWVNTENPINLADLKGKKVILVEFFMVQCPHCVEATSQLRRLQENYQEDGLLIVSVARDPVDQIKAFLEKNELKITAACDQNDKTAADYGVYGVPWSFLIGASGKIVWQGDPRALDEIQLQSELMDLKPAEKKEAK